jgi:hypothetical protein
MSVIEKWVAVDCPRCGSPARARVQHVAVWGALPGAHLPHRVSVLCGGGCHLLADEAREAVRRCPHCDELV